ncbi:hypothetical protein SCLCIDRAFT_1216252 [Scleroderma citrinum Foug A]|uniref:Uncharacterized protein n=1 Tax=Scleroderma citrinum Foug A TaxID=1036808 RepID=A0A0C3DZ55_9AGAM|nr:hypothetical protein SCLCIDRAFT_1216252 [Scleroderma citrinum Foug A]
MTDRSTLLPILIKSKAICVSLMSRSKSTLDNSNGRFLQACKREHPEYDPLQSEPSTPHPDHTRSRALALKIPYLTIPVLMRISCSTVGCALSVGKVVDCQNRLLPIIFVSSGSNCERKHQERGRDDPQAPILSPKDGVRIP